MTALAANREPNAWAQGFNKADRRAAAASVADGTRPFIGSLVMSVDGIARPVLAGTAMIAVCTTIPGADANGGVALRSRRANVTVQFAGGLTKTLGVTSITYGATIAVLIQQGTDGGGAVTNTAEQMCNLIRGNGELNDLLACKATGTGAGLTATAAATAIAHVALLGVSQYEYDARDAAVDLGPDDVFAVGSWGCLPDTGTAPTLNAPGYLLDDQTVSGAADPIAFVVPVVLIDARGLYYVNLFEAR